jgi:16S rRNA (cytosine967-C5)-methyltransferase
MGCYDNISDRLKARLQLIDSEKLLDVKSTLESLMYLPQNPVKRLGILYSFPDWMIQFWLDQLGLEETEKLCQWFNQSPTIDLRINPLENYQRYC